MVFQHFCTNASRISIKPMVLQQFCVHMFKYARKTNEILTIPSASQPTSQPTSQPASERANQPGSQAARQPASQQPARSQPARQPGSQAAGQAAKQPESRHPRQVLHHKVLQMTRVHVRPKSIRMCERAKIMRRRPFFTHVGTLVRCCTTRWCR